MFMRLFANFFSFVFHPLLHFLYFIIYLYFTTAIFYQYKNKIQFIYLLLIIIVLTVVFPILFSVFTQKNFKKEDKNYISTQLISVAFIYLMLIYFSDSFLLPNLLIQYLKLSLICITLLIVIHFRFKVCIYSTSISFILIFIGFLSNINPSIHFWVLVFNVIIAGILMSARVFLGKADLLSVIRGFLIALCSGIPIFFLYKP